MARLCNFILCVCQKHYFLRYISYPDVPWCSRTQNTKLHKQQSRHWRFNGIAQRLVNVLKLVSNMELQRAPDNAKYYSSFLSSSNHHSSSSAPRILSIFPFEWEIDGDLSSFYRASTYSSCLVNTNYAASLSSGPPPCFCCCEAERFLLLRQVAWTTMIWRDISSLKFPGCTVWLLALDRQCGGTLPDIPWWPVCLIKTPFQIHSEQGPQFLWDQKVEKHSILQNVCGAFWLVHFWPNNIYLA